MRILIVEHNPLVRTALSQVMRLAYERSPVVEAANAAAALHLCRTEQPDLVLLGVGLPHAVGIDLAARLKAVLPSTRIVVVSHHETPVYQDAAHAAGADAYVSRDEMHEALLGTVSRALAST